MTNNTPSIVAGVDGSPASRAAALVARDLAEALGRRLVLAHAADDPPPFPYGDSRVRELERRRALRAGRRLLRRAADGLDAELKVVLGDPAERLAEVADDEAAELLVVAARGRSGLAAALLGSVSQRLAAIAGRPVLIVPPHAAERCLEQTLEPAGRDAALV